MNKRKCRNRECNQFFRPPITEIYIKAFWCSPECKEAIAIANLHKQQANRLKAREKAEKKAKSNDKKRLGQLQPVSHWLKRTQEVFNEYIRLRDADCGCISCGTKADNQYCAGHFRTRGAAGHLRFDERNVHKQCNKRCNLELSGNISGYRPRLIKKIGLAEVEALENDNSLKSWNREELDELRKVYRAKIKALHC
jgi:hypothetical protein